MRSKPGINKVYIIFLIFVLIFVLYSSNLLAVGVRPLSLDLEMEQGESSTFELELVPEGTEETVALNLYYPRQQITGTLTFEEGDLEQHEVLNWIALPDEVTVPPDEEVEVTGEINVPFDAEGTHTAVVMVEPLMEDGEGISLQVRYAVRISIHVDAPGLREDAELLDFDLEADEDDQPLLTAHMENPSPLMYNAAGEVTVRDESRQLIERVTLKTEGGSRKPQSIPARKSGLKVRSPSLWLRAIMICSYFSTMATAAR